MKIKFSTLTPHYIHAQISLNSKWKDQMYHEGANHSRVPTYRNPLVIISENFLKYSRTIQTQDDSFRPWTRENRYPCWMLQSIGCALQRRVFLLCVFQAAACNKKYVIILIQWLSSPFCKYDQNKTTSADSICESESRFIAGICVPWHGSLCRKHPCVS